VTLRFTCFLVLSTQSTAGLIYIHISRLSWNYSYLHLGAD